MHALNVASAGPVTTFSFRGWSFTQFTAEVGADRCSLRDKASVRSMSFQYWLGVTAPEADKSMVTSTTIELALGALMSGDTGVPVRCFQLMKLGGLRESEEVESVGRVHCGGRRDLSFLTFSFERLCFRTKCRFKRPVGWAELRAPFGRSRYRCSFCVLLSPVHRVKKAVDAVLEHFAHEMVGGVETTPGGFSGLAASYVWSRSSSPSV